MSVSSFCCYHKSPPDDVTSRSDVEASHGQFAAEFGEGRVLGR